MRRMFALAPAAIALLVMTSCTPATSDTSVLASSPSGALEGPPPGAVIDYQLGTAYPPAAGVAGVVRDRTAAPADGMYSVCYVNAFQTQPGESGRWPAEALLTRDGAPVIDPDWPDEVIVDTSTPRGRAAVVELVGGWIRGCAAAGFRAVEFDNLDTFTRTDGALSLEDNLAVATTLVSVAHEAGLAAGQKNAAEFADRLHRDARFDYAVSEECAAYGECDAYTEVYGAHVIDVEYTDALPRPFVEMCRDAETPASTILRDRALSAPGGPDYAFDTCAAHRR